MVNTVTRVSCHKNEKEDLQLLLQSAVDDYCYIFFLLFIIIITIIIIAPLAAA